MKCHESTAIKTVSYHPSTSSDVGAGLIPFPAAVIVAIMASSATNPDTLVTLKVNIEGSNRRFKLPLRDLGANTLPEKV